MSQLNRLSQSSETGKRKSRKRNDNIVLKNVVSLRVSDQEKEVIEKITRTSSRNVSEVVREALELWLSRHRKLCGDL